MPTPPPAAAMAHSPLPWEVTYLDRNGQRVVRSEHIEICTCWHHSVGSIEREMEANAALIVRCVNSHAALVEALEECRATLAMMVDPAAIVASNVQHAAAKCIAAETKARAALARALAGGAG